MKKPLMTPEQVFKLNTNMATEAEAKEALLNERLFVEKLIAEKQAELYDLQVRLDGIMRDIDGEDEPYDSGTGDF